MTSMRLALLVAALLFVTTPARPALAGPATEAVRSCINASTTPADLDDLILYAFAAMSKHPKLQGYTTMTSVQRDAIYARAGAAVSRIVLVDCREEMIESMVREGGPDFRAFIDFSEPMNRASMTNPLVVREISLLRNYMDAGGMQALVEAAKARAKAAKEGAEPAR